MEERNNLTVSEHTHELKRRVLTCGGVFLAAFILCYVKSDTVLGFLLQTGRDAGYTLGYLSPQEMLVQSLRVSATAAAVLVLPFILWHLARFIAPAVSKGRARRTFNGCIAVSYVLLLAGLAFSIEILFPTVFTYLYSYGTQFDVESYVSVEQYLSMFLSVTWIIGFIFEFPVVCAGLGMCGVLTPQKMLKSLKPALLVSAVLSAIITPPDAVSMLMVMVPMMLVYFAGAGACALFSRRRKKEAEGK